MLPRTILTATLLLSLAAGASAQVSESHMAGERQAIINEAIEKMLPAYAFIGGGGSGVLVSPDGYILTNDHVAGSAWVWRVRTMDGELRYADLIGTDPYGDIALLKVRDVTDLPYLPFGDAHELVHGQTVIALGNPFGMGNVDEKPTVTLGIVSALHRFQGNYTDAIMTDAPLNPGNSGGPLVTLDGKLVGINGQIATRFGVRANSGIGYAITINQIRNFLQDLMAAKGGYVRHGEITGLELPEPEDNVRPPRVSSVAPGSPAAKAGFQAGDEILEVEGRPITTVTRFHGVVGTYPAGSDLEVKIRRKSEMRTIGVKLAPRALPGDPVFRAPLSGEAYQHGGGMPLHVVAVEDGTPAKAAGVQVGDRIMSIAGINVGEALEMSPQPDLLDKVVQARSALGGLVLELTVLRAGRKEQLVLDVDQGASKLGVQLGRIENNGGGKDPAAALARELTIVDLVEGSGLARAGLEIGDVVVGLDGKTLSDYKGFHELVAKLTPGSMVRVVFRRGGETKEVDARVDLHHPMQ